jgi:hypothetical protein
MARARIRMQVVLALTATVLALGAGSTASAATLFSNTSHVARLAASTPADATSAGPVTFTDPVGNPIGRCTHSSLELVVDGNTNDTNNAVSLTVASSTFAAGCTGPIGQPVGTHTARWRITLLGTATPSGSFTRWSGTVHGVELDFPGNLLFSGNLETGVTLTQPTMGTSPICIDLNNSGVLASPVGLAMSIDAKYCFTGGPAAWSLTN